MPRSAPRLLMCRPDYYSIEYEINPWMDRRRDTDRKLASEQWAALVRIFEELGVTLEFIDPVGGLPDMVFTANAGLVHHDLFVTSRFSPKERQGESEQFERWFDSRGWRTICLASQKNFEGAGDALFCGKTLYAGYRHRSEIQAHHELAELLGCRVLSLELIDPRFYHLDTCFCPLAPGQALYYPPALDEYARRVLWEHIPDLIAVSDSDAFEFGCNAVVIGNQIVLNAASDELSDELSSRNFSVHQTALSEFLKAGGAAKCLTLRLDGEEAAVW